MRVAGQQVFDLRQCLLGLVAAMQDHGVVLARGVETGGQFEAARQQVQRILVAAHAGGDFGEHADRRHIGGRLFQMLAQQRLRLRDAAFGERHGGAHQARVVGGMQHVPGVGGIGRVLLAGRHQMVAEFAPGLRQIGLQRDRAAQRGDRLFAPAEPTQHHAQVELQRRPGRLRRRQRKQDVERGLGIVLAQARGGQQAQRERMGADRLQDLVELLHRQRGVALQQPLRVRQRLLQRAAGRYRDHAWPRCGNGSGPRGAVGRGGDSSTAPGMDGSGFSRVSPQSTTESGR